MHLLHRSIACLFLTLTLGGFVAADQAWADCATSNTGRETCGAGECAVSSTGFVKCSKHVGGGAQVSSTGTVKCGVGACVVTPSGFVKCSSVAGGHARVDGAFARCTDSSGDRVSCDNGSTFECE